MKKVHQQFEHFRFFQTFGFMRDFGANDFTGSA
jgi:hypothetical protein